MANFDPGNNISLEEGIKLYQSKAQQALGVLHSQGFGQPVPPVVASGAGNMPYQGSIPTNLPELDDNQLGYYMGLLTEWNNYVQYKLAEASIYYKMVKEIQEFIEAKLRVAYGRDEDDKKRSNPERDDFMRSDRRFIDASSDVIYWETLFTYLRAITNSAEQAFAAVSRRITQRGQEIDRGNRHNSINNMPHTGPLFRSRQ